MYGIGWASRWLSPRRRLTVLAGFVVVLMVAQFTLVVVGGVLARDEATRALDDTFVFLADVSEERALTFSRAAERAVIEVARQVPGDEGDPSALLEQLHTELAIASEVSAVAVTYRNGDYVALRRVGGLRGGFSAYIITHDESGLVTRTSVEYDSSMVQQSSDPQPVILNPRTSDSYRAAVQAQSPVWGEPAIDPWTSAKEVWLSRASVMPGGAVVVVSAAITLDELARRLNELPTGSDGEVCLLSREREVVAAQSTPGNARAQGNPRSADCAATNAATPQDGDVWGTDGGFRTLERGLSARGVDWVLHLHASTAGLNRGFAQVRVIFRGVIVGTAILTLALGYILFRVWRPVREMRDDVERDPLTGLRNRRDVDGAVGRTLRTAERIGGSVAVVMLDIDHFKRINDELGHTAGDRALKSLGKALNHAVRSGDSAVRWGGDEFLLVLLIAPADDAAANVESIRLRLEELLRRVLPGIEGLGVTAGYTLCERSGVDPDALVAQADKALVDGKLVKKGASYAAGTL